MNAHPPIHASCVAIGAWGVLLRGPSGAGKSDLALRLIDRGAVLVSDDYTCLAVANGCLIASAPPRIAGKIEVRGVGILALPVLPDIPIALIVDLDRPVERLPDAKSERLLGVPIPVIAISAFEASAPIKLERALAALTQDSH